MVSSSDIFFDWIGCKKFLGWEIANSRFIPLSYSCYEEATRGFGGEIGVNYPQLRNSDFGCER